MPTVKEITRASATRKKFVRLMEDVSEAKKILTEITSKNPEGLPWYELVTLFRKRMPLKRKIIDVFGFGCVIGLVFAIALDDLTEEGRIREEAMIFYPR